MKIKKYIKRVGTYLIKGVPENHVTAEVVSLAPNNLLRGRTALITGGTSGIGFSIAKAYLASGATVVITSRKSEKLNQSCAKLKGLNSDYQNRVFGVTMDNTNVSSFNGTFNNILQSVGG